VFRGVVSAAETASTLPTDDLIDRIICEITGRSPASLVGSLPLHLLLGIFKTLLSWWPLQATGRDGEQEMQRKELDQVLLGICW
jgi:hypothetical protein